MYETETIKQVLMRRDGLTADQAEVAVQEAKELLSIYLDEGDMESAENLCMEEFGLEQDYIMELLW